MEGRIPLRFRIGVSGHRSMGDAQRVSRDVDAAVSRLLGLLAGAPQSETTPIVPTVVSALAEGADRVVAEAVLTYPGARLEVVLPLAPEEYEQTFMSDSARREFRSLLARADDWTDIDPQPSRGHAYLEAGLQILDRIDVLITIWDGQPARGRGGTAELVAEARRRKLPMIWIAADPDGRVVDEVDGEQRPLGAADVAPLSPAAFAEIDRYNRGSVHSVARSPMFDIEAITAASKVRSSPEEDARISGLIKWIAPFYFRASATAKHFQARRNRLEGPLFGLATAAVIAVAVQVAFFRSEPAYAVAEVFFIALAFIVLRLVRRSRVRDRYVSARYLAEWLRAAYFLALVGVRGRAGVFDNVDAADEETEWLRRAFTEVWLTQPRAAAAESDVDWLLAVLSEAWIEDQHGYFSGASRRHDRRQQMLARSTEALFALSFVVAVAHTLHLGGEALGDWLVLLSISLPMSGAALHAMADQREYRRHADRYARTAGQVAALRPKVTAASTLADVQDVALSMERLMREEAGDWFGVVRLRETELPF